MQLKSDATNFRLTSNVWYVHEKNFGVYFSEKFRQLGRQYKLQSQLVVTIYPWIVQFRCISNFSLENDSNECKYITIIYNFSFVDVCLY